MCFELHFGIVVTPAGLYAQAHLPSTGDLKEAERGAEHLSPHVMVPSDAAGELNVDISFTRLEYCEDTTKSNPFYFRLRF